MDAPSVRAIAQKDMSSGSLCSFNTTGRGAGGSYPGSPGFTFFLYRSFAFNFSRYSSASRWLYAFFGIPSRPPNVSADSASLALRGIVGAGRWYHIGRLAS